AKSERLLLDFSERLARASGECFVAEIESGLRQLIGALGFDRITVGEFGSDGLLHMLCSVAVEGMQPISRGPAPASAGWYVNEIKAARAVVFRSLDDLPPEASAVAQYFRATGLQSQVGIPLSVADRVVGCIGFDSFSAMRAWPDDVPTHLKLIAEVCAQTLARKCGEEDLARATAEIKE